MRTICLIVFLCMLHTCAALASSVEVTFSGDTAIAAPVSNAEAGMLTLGTTPPELKVEYEAINNMEFQWSIDENGIHVVGNDYSSSSVTLKANSEDAGIYSGNVTCIVTIRYKDKDRVSATAHHVISCQVEITLYDIEKVQYKSGGASDDWTDIPDDGIAVAKNAEMTYKALPTEGAPSDWYSYLEWTYVDTNTEDAAAADYPTASSSPSDYKEMTAHLGDSTKCKDVSILVVDLSALKIKAKRTSTPVETDYFEVLSNEHFDAGSTFEFKLELNDGTNTWPLPVLMGAEVWDTDGFCGILKREERITSPTILYTFNTGTVVDIGNCRTKFYFDHNFSADSDSNGYDPCVNSKGYWVMNRKAYGLTFASVPGITLPYSISAMINAANECFLKKEKRILAPDINDYRACVQISQSGATNILPTGYSVIHCLPVWGASAQISIYEPDPKKANGYRDEWGEASSLRALGFDCSIIQRIVSVTPDKTIEIENLDGLAPSVGTMSIILSSESNFDLLTFAHEFGHGAGISGDYRGPDDYVYLMYFSTILPPALLKQSEAFIIDGGIIASWP